MAYKLQLPASSSIHPIFHVSQLKSVVGQKHTVVPSLPTDIDGLQVHVQVLARRLIQCGGALVPQVKVAWSGWDHSLVTWEDTEALKATFPHASAWGQAVSEVVGIVSDTPREAEDGDRAVKNGQREIEEGDVARPQRQKRANKRVMGPKWAV